MLLRRRRKKNARKENNCVSIREFYLLLWSAWGNSLRGKRERERYIKRSLQRRKKDNNNTRWWEQCAVPKRAVLVRLHKLFFCFFFFCRKEKNGKSPRQRCGHLIPAPSVSPRSSCDSLSLCSFTLSSLLPITLPLPIQSSSVSLWLTNFYLFTCTAAATHFISLYSLPKWSPVDGDLQLWRK